MRFHERLEHGQREFFSLESRLQHLEDVVELTVPYHRVGQQSECFLTFRCGRSGLPCEPHRLGEPALDFAQLHGIDPDQRITRRDFLGLPDQLGGLRDLVAPPTNQ